MDLIRPPVVFGIALICSIIYDFDIEYLMIKVRDNFNLLGRILIV